MIKYLIICPLVFLAGFIDAIAGGGGLISLPAYMMSGIPAHSCIATNKMSSAMGTSIATAKYIKSGFIPWSIALFCIPMAFAGSAMGANIAMLIADDIFKMIMLAVIPCTAIYVLTKKDVVEKEASMSLKKIIPICMLISFLLVYMMAFMDQGREHF